jgi:hypothetical protein
MASVIELDRRNLDRHPVGAWRPVRAGTVARMRVRVDLSEPGDEPVLPHRAPTSEAVVQSAGASPLRQKVEGLRAYLGEQGRVLTDTGNLKLADARALVERLDTGDVPDRQHGTWTHTMRTSAELPWLNLIVDAAVAAGAVRRVKNRLVPVKAWDRRPVEEQAAALGAAVFDLGAHTWGRRKDDGTAWSVIDDVLDESALHLLAPGLAPGVVLELEVLIERTIELLEDRVGHLFAHFSGEREAGPDLAEHHVTRTMAALELAGLVEWHGSRTEEDRFGVEQRVGGYVRVSPLGHAVFVPRLTADGYRIEAIPSPAGLSGAEAIDLVLEVVGSAVELLLLPAEAVEPDPDDPTGPRHTTEEAPRPASPLRAELVAAFGAEVADDTRAVLRAQRAMVGELLAEWQDGRPVLEAAAELVAAILEGGGAAERVAALALCGLLGPDAELPVRALLDGPLGGHAVLWLTTHTDADPDELVAHVTLAPVVDTLALTAEDPDADLEEVAERFDLMVNPDERLDAIAALRRLPLAEVADVLDVLGRVHRPGGGRRRPHGRRAAPPRPPPPLSDEPFAGQTFSPAPVAGCASPGLQLVVGPAVARVGAPVAVTYRRRPCVER